MKIKTLTGTVLTISLLTVPQVANSSSSFDTAASGTAWATSATSQSTWASSTDPNGVNMRFEVAAQTNLNVDITIAAVSSGSAVDFTNGTCQLALPYMPVQGESVTVSVLSSSATNITCRVAVANWFAGMGRSFALQVDSATLNTSDGYGEVKVGLFNIDNSMRGPGSSVIPTRGTETARYSGPEFSGLSGLGVMHGSSTKLEGKNLDEVSSIEVGGKAATFKATSETELELTLPEGLAPGMYDLVINSGAGKLTHINAIRVREPLKSFSITSRSEGRISEEQYQEHSIVASMQIPELTKARCIVNASNLAQARLQAQRLCALVKGANPNIETTVIDARSTVKDETVYARVIFGWN